MSQLTRAQVAERTGASPRQLDHWTRRGWLDAQMPGTGYRAEWSMAAIQAARLMARLVAAGLTPAAAARVARGERELAPGVTVHLEAA